MDANKKATAAACLKAAETDAKTFPEILSVLSQEDFEGYEVDFRRSVTTYYTTCGKCLTLDMHKVSEPVAATFDATALQRAIREAQEKMHGYTYLGFCKKAVAAGCASYIASLSGRRALYIGRTAETHVEPFPN